MANMPFSIILKEQLISHNEKARLKTLAQWRVKLQHGDTATEAETDKSPSRKKKRSSLRRKSKCREAIMPHITQLKT